MNQPLIIATLFALMSMTSQAQWLKDVEQDHAVGYGYAVGIPYNISGSSFASQELAYHGRYYLPVSEDFSWGIGTPVSVGTPGPAGLSLSYALALEFDAGMGATMESKKSFGVFGSVGFGSFDMLYLTDDGISIRLDRSTYYGPYLGTGVRLYYRGQPVGLSLNTWRNMNTVLGKVQVISLRLLYGL